MLIKRTSGTTMTTASITTSRETTAKAQGNTLILTTRAGYDRMTVTLTGEEVQAIRDALDQHDARQARNVLKMHRQLTMP